jgi:peptidoglycan biosynthesis protein MviN/MurJ (putative lipid II flippase)
VSKRTASSGLGSLATGALTASSFLIVSVVAAVTGVVIAREFGRSAETDGVLAAYGLSVVIAIAAQAIRIAVLPSLARARDEQRLAGELAGYGAALLVAAIPLLVASVLGTEWLAGLLTGGESEVAKDTAADALRWMVPAGVLQLYAAVAVSGLAALDDYATAAFGYSVASVLGLALILLRVGPDGIVAIAWGVALNGAVAFAIPAAALAMRAVLSRMPAAAIRATASPLRARLTAFAIGAALPLALQLLYVVCLAFASRLDTGDATSFVYAYLAAAALVATTAGSLGIVTSVPLSRAGLDAAEAVRHVVATSWLALVVVGAAAGVFALAGGNLVESALGGAYAEDVGADLGRLVVAFSPWMVASIGIGVTFPLAFVAGRTRRLPLIAIGALAVQVPVAWGAARWLGLEGLALALAATTLLVLVILLVELDALEGAARPLAIATLAVVGLVVASFVPPAVALGDLASAALGLVLYGTLITFVRPRGLAIGWRYLRALG